MGCFGGGTNTQTTQPTYTDAFGNRGPNKQATKLRAGVWSDMQGLQPQANANTADVQTRLNSAENDPGFGQMGSLAREQIAGKYLHGSPELTNQINRIQAAGQRAGADSAANIKSMYARNGMTFGTANQQAQQASRAAYTAQAQDTAANLAASNYARERGIQNASGDELTASILNPANIAGQKNNSLYQNLNNRSGLITGLATGGTTMNPDNLVTQKPSFINYAQQVMSLM
jgi:hypothetical protein